ncbi:MAG: apolipoprotein N-acyltransferase [Actinomycetes bacterium]
MAFRKILFAIVSGYLCYLASRPHEWFLAILGCAIFAFTLTDGSRRNRLIHSVVFAAAMYIPLLTWMKTLGVDAWVLISLLSILPWLLLALLPTLDKSLRSIANYSCAVVLIEYVHSAVPLGGFPWGLLAYTQLDGPLIWLARLGSQYAVSFAVVFVGLMMWRAYSLKSVRALGVLAIACGAGAVLFGATNAQTTTLKVAAIQGNVPRLGYDPFTQAMFVTENHIAQTNSFIADIAHGNAVQPDLVIWPENGVDGDPLSAANSELFNRIQTMVNELNVPAIIGALILDSAALRPTNSGLLWQPAQEKIPGSESFTHAGVAQRYDKIHLVPFGEYIPNRAFFTQYIGRLGQVPVDFRPGSVPGIFDVGSLKVGDVICFEIAYDDHVRATLATGASLLAVQSNNATYAHTEQPRQQLAITRFRAIEHQRSTVVATTTGYSAVIRPDGSLLDVSREMTADVVSGEVPLNSAKQISDYLSDWIVVFFACYLGLTLLSIRRNSKGATWIR